MIDIGSNLTHPKLNKNAAGLDKLIQSSREYGLKAIIAIGTNLTESEESLAIARSYPEFIYATAGVHPHDAKDMKEEDWARLAQLTAQPEIVAAGEMGLDFNRNYSPQRVQIEVFEKQLAANSDCRKPLYLHERDAIDTQVQILKNQHNNFTTGVIHCFTGDEKALKTYLDLGLYIGLTGWICDERRGQELAEAVKYIPESRLLVETDSPFLLPRTLTPKPGNNVNYPWFVSEVIKKIAASRREQPTDVIEYTTANAQHLFGIAANG